MKAYLLQIHFRLTAFFPKDVFTPYQRGICYFKFIVKVNFIVYSQKEFMVKRTMEKFTFLDMIVKSVQILS